MRLSRYFADHANAYDAEINDLVSDSEGKNILEKRLREKRSQLDFLVLMMEDSPEMLAAAFHQGFRFNSSAKMDQFAGLQPDALPGWKAVSQIAVPTAWAQPMIARVLQEDGGDRFLCVAAVLEYLYTRADPEAAARAAEEEKENDDEDSEEARDHGADSDGDNDELNDSDAAKPDLEEAGADWLQDQGFDRKE